MGDLDKAKRHLMFSLRITLKLPKKIAERLFKKIEKDIKENHNSNISKEDKYLLYADEICENEKHK